MWTSTSSVSTDPAGPVTRHWYAPVTESSTAGSTSLSRVAPGSFRPLNDHWYRSGRAPRASTASVTVSPGRVWTARGCRTMVGGSTAGGRFSCIRRRARWMISSVENFRPSGATACRASGLSWYTMLVRTLIVPEVSAWNPYLESSRADPACAELFHAYVMSFSACAPPT